jgi:hypothetical protein
MTTYAYGAPLPQGYIVPLKCYVCGEVYGSTESAHPGYSSGICRKSECLKTAREGARRGK